MRITWTIALICAAPVWAQAPIRIVVDATGAPRRVFHVEMTMPASPGPMTLLYPEWIPGEHAPDGPVTELAGLYFKAGGQTLAWKRDSVNMFAFHLEAPAGATSIEVSFDFLAAPELGGEFSSAASTTTELTVISWNQLLFYPQGADADRLAYQATLRLPEGWKFGTALATKRQNGNETEFEAVSLTTLIDSPLSAGAHYRTIDLGEVGGAKHYLHLAGDSERSVEMSAAQVLEYRELVAEANALFGAHHYGSYHFLYTLSNHVAHFGLEHHESSDDRLGEQAVTDEGISMVSASLLSHEFVHSWNGKYRRPSGLVDGTHDGGYDTPMKGDLLWVYEGLTEYLGVILAPRSGLQKPQEFREGLAITAAALNNQSGRKWRPVEDTAVAAQLYYTSGNDYTDYRRGVDFYPEGETLWLDVDARIRQLSGDKKKLDDFCKAFHGAPSGPPAMKPYDFEDVVAVLNAIQPYDWAGFLNERLKSTAPRTPDEALEGAGWKLAYDDVRSDFWKALEESSKMDDFTYSLGFIIKDDEASVSDVRFGGPAQLAGVTPGDKVLAVNGHQFTAAVLRDALKAGAHGGPGIDLLVKTGEYYQTHRIDYHGGERYPHLVRDGTKPDLLSEMIAPAAKQ